MQQEEEDFMIIKLNSDRAARDTMLQMLPFQRMFYMGATLDES